mgnify:CR=1 FL=1
MKSFFLFIVFLSLVPLTASSQHYIGPIDICYDNYDDAKDGFTEYLNLTSASNQHFHRLYKKTFTNPGCDANPYKTVFFDDFDGDKLNAQRWRNDSNNFPPLNLIRRCDNELAHLSLPQSITVSGGYAHLKTEKLDSTLTFRCEDPETPGNMDTITVERKFSCGRIMSRAGLPGSQGCFRQGKFTVRAKIPENNNNSTGAYWFYGWAAEIDVVEVCQPDCNGEIQSNRHLWIENPGFAAFQTCDGESDNMDYPKDHYIGNIYAFHTYTLEWTPTLPYNRKSNIIKY